MMEIMALLRRGEETTAPELAVRLGVSRRTISRDLDALCRAGFPVETARGHGGGVRMRREQPPAERGWRLLAVFDPGERERLSDARPFELEGGALLVSRDFARYDEMLRWVSGFGDRVRVLEPEELAGDLRRQAQRVLETYAKR